MILRWLLCAAKALSGEELWQAVRSEYLRSLPRKGACETWDEDSFDESKDRSNTDSVATSDRESDDSSDDDFLFSRSEIENMCGSLVATTNGEVQVAHPSIADFLRHTSPSVVYDAEIRDFFVNMNSANLHLTKVCIQALHRSLGTPPIEMEDRGRKIRPHNLIQLIPFLNYSVRHWLFHLRKSGKANLDPAKVKLRKFMLGPKMLYWLEMWFTIEDITTWDLQQQLRNLALWCDSQEEVPSPNGSFSVFIYRWSQGVSQLLERHGPSLEEDPSEIHFIDPCSYNDSNDGNSIFADFETPDPPIHIPHFQLQSQVFSYVRKSLVDKPRTVDLPRHDLRQLTLFHVQKQRRVILMASYSTSIPEVRCQDVKTGRNLKPAPLICEHDNDRRFYCEGFAISPSGNFLAMLYCSETLKDTYTVKDRYDINVWKLAENIDFEQSENVPWCKIVKFMSIKAPFRGYSAGRWLSILGIFFIVLGVVSTLKFRVLITYSSNPAVTHLHASILYPSDLRN